MMLFACKMGQFEFVRPPLEGVKIGERIFLEDDDTIDVDKTEPLLPDKSII